MKKTAGLCSLLVLLAALPACDAIPGITASPEGIDFQRQIYPELDPETVELIDTEPIFTGGGFGAWDERLVSPGDAIYYEGLFHMFYVGVDGDTGGIGHAVSTDGLVWHRFSDRPLIRADHVPYQVQYINGLSVIPADGGLQLYFSAYDQRDLASSGVIGRAVAGDSRGPWQINPEPLLSHGSLGTWDSWLLADPNLVVAERGYRLYYTGFNLQGENPRIGLALSTDGIAWEKYNDPETTQENFSLSDPLNGLTPPSGDSPYVYNPRVWQTPQGWAMLFLGREDQRTPDTTVNYATSLDGLSWTPYEGNPIYRPDGIEGVDGIIKSAVIFHEGQFFIYFAVFGENIPNAIYAATARPVSD